jgi:endoglucanase
VLSHRLGGNPVVMAGCAALVALSLLLAGCTGDGDESDHDEPLGTWSPIGATNAVIRVDQVGFATNDHKVAWLLARQDAAGVSWSVERRDGEIVDKGTVGPDSGSWNETYPDVHAIDLSKVTEDGEYRIRVGSPETAATADGTVAAVSPTFRIESADDLFTPVAAHVVEFFTAQRDGDDVSNDPLPRSKSHLHDSDATVYQTPSFGGSSDDKLEEDLSPVDEGPATVDAAGGWFDAGDYLKFTHTTAYALSLMLLAQRGPVDGDGKDIDGLSSEAQHGLDWLDKMWDADTGTLYAQVGLGSGTNGIVGDHDVWRLPQSDDSATGDSKKYLRNRPVFRAAAPGDPLSPNLAGRVAAAFALAAQVEAADDPTAAKAHLAAAAKILAQAKTTDVGTLVTVFPRSYYGEGTWTDDMAFGTTELALAGRALKDPRATAWMAQAAGWAKTNLDAGSRDPLNLYDTGPIADADLAALLTATDATGLPVTQQTLIGDLKARLDKAQTAAQASVAAGTLGTASTMKGSDYTSRTFGWVALAGMYRELTGDDSYAPLETSQRDLALGGNGWGMTLIVGVGTTYPHCPHHQVADLAGSRTGKGKILTGAVVNGPNKTSAFDGLNASSDQKPCTGVKLSAFDRSDSRFLDATYAYSSNEPAIDYTATGLFALAVTARAK